MTFPPYPTCNRDIYEYSGPGEYMACTIVRKKDIRQVMVFRKLRMMLGEQHFRECLCEALDILAHAIGIAHPAGWLYKFISQECTGFLSYQHAGN